MTKEIFERGFTIPVWVKTTVSEQWYASWMNKNNTRFVPETNPSSVLVLYLSDTIVFRDPNKLVPNMVAEPV